MRSERLGSGKLIYVCSVTHSLAHELRRVFLRWGEQFAHVRVLYICFLLRKRNAARRRVEREYLPARAPHVPNTARYAHCANGNETYPQRCASVLASGMHCLFSPQRAVRLGNWAALGGRTPTKLLTSVLSSRPWLAKRHDSITPERSTGRAPRKDLNEEALFYYRLHRQAERGSFGCHTRLEYFAVRILLMLGGLYRFRKMQGPLGLVAHYSAIICPASYALQKYRA